jgi:5-methylcytosine-specific restriction enzyme A
MALSPHRPCAKPGCPNLVRGARYCDAHRGTQSSSDHADHYAPRHGLSRAKWTKTRLAFLANHPFCADCLQRGEHVRATDVDHIHGVESLEHDPYCWDNLRGLCHSCHSKKTYRTTLALRSDW